jgi:hypothetical protein
MMMRLLRLSGKIFTAGRREKGGQNTREKSGNFQKTKQNKQRKKKEKKKQNVGRKEIFGFHAGSVVF